MARTSNEIVELFIKDRDLTWMQESAILPGEPDREWTKIRLTRKQWKWLLDVWNRENQAFERTAGGKLEDGTYWDAKFNGYTRASQNADGTGSLKLWRKLQPETPEPKDDVDFDFNPDCPICLRHRDHTIAEHEAALRRSYEMDDSNWYDPGDTEYGPRLLPC